MPTCQLCFHGEGELESATTDSDDVQTRTQMWLRHCQLEISANAAVGEVYASGTACPQSRLASLENVSHKVNSGPYYSTIWCSANRAISIHWKRSSMWFSSPTPFPSPHAGRDSLPIRNHRRYLQVWSMIIAQLDRWKTHRRGRQTGCGVNGDKKSGGKKKKAWQVEVEHVLLASAQLVPWIQATCINSRLTWLTCSWIRQTQIKEW